MIQIDLKIVVGVSLVLIILSIFIYLLYEAYIKRIMHEQRRLYQAKLMHERKMLDVSISIKEDECKRIALMLHDDIGSKLNIISIWINNKENWNSDQSREIISNQVPKIAEAIRSISHTLFPSVIERLGLISAIEELLSYVTSEVNTRIVILNKFQPLPLQSEIQIYRIVQEFLNNVLKHSQATEMTINIKSSPMHLVIVLSDNGVGFNVNEIKNGMGLDNIQVRLHSLNAKYKWKTFPNNGCRLVLKIENCGY